MSAIRFAWLLIPPCALTASGQQYYVQNWHVEDGLPDGEITAIQQTPDGYLWIGTPKGLARFDGVRFKVFKASSNSGLPDSRITWLMTSHEGTLWISTQDGNIVRRRDGKFENARPPLNSSLEKEKRSPGSWLWERRMHIIEGNEGPDDQGALGNRTQLFEDSYGAVWGHVSGTEVIRLKDDHWSVFTPSNGLPAGGVRQLTSDREGHVWAEAGGKLHRYDESGWDTIQSAVPLGGRWPVFAPANKGGLWVGEPHGSWFLNGGEVKRFANKQWYKGPKPIPAIPLTPGSTVTCLLEDHSGRIWYGTASGGVFFSGPDGSWQRLKAQNPFSQGYITCLFEDSQGNIWVGTVEDGLYRVTSQPLNMVTLPPTFENAEINTVCVANDGALWIGTGGFGILRYEDNKFQTFGEAEGLRNLHVCTIFEDSRTNVWAGTQEGLFRLESGRFAQIQGPHEMATWVKVLYEDRAGGLWIGTVGALIYRHGEEFEVHYLRSDHGYCDIRSIAEDSAGDLWIGTIGQGLFLLPHNQPEKLHHVDGFPATDARALFCGKDGTLWIGSWGEGLIRGSNGKFTTFASEDGLPSDRIQSIINDEDNRIWLSTDNGVVGITPEVIQNYKHGNSPPLWCQHLSFAEGLANRGCSGSGQPVSVRLADGRLLFPDYEGIAMLDPHTVVTRALTPEVLVESVLADGKPLATEENGEFRAPSSARRFEFDYTAPDLALPQHLCFRYKLDGLDHDWVKAGVQNIAYYSQLKPGLYQFQVMVGGSDGEWHGANYGLQLRIIPRWWERRWIQALASALLISTLVAVLTWAQRRKLRLQMERLEMQQAVENERRRIARDLHDELGARLTATALQGELAMQDGKIPDHAKSQMNLITRRVRQLIGAVDEVVWTTDPENDSLSNVVAFLCDHVEQFLAPTGIRCRLEIAQDLPVLSLAAQTRRNLLLAVKETLNNGVRHSAAKMIRLSIQIESGWLNIEISDDGHGFDTTHARAGGQGLSNIRRRMELIKGRVEITSQIGSGTNVVLSIPLPRHEMHMRN
jgi:ligand-binding sensor domain-containing protein/signal transduction histidine kinase